METCGAFSLGMMRRMEVTDTVLINRSGKRMPATYYVADNAKGTCVVLHGIGGWRGQEVVNAIVDAVTAEGYAAVTFDTADGPMAPDADSLSMTTSACIEDLEDVIAHIRKEPWYQEPLILAGHSLGALVASEYAGRHKDIERLVLVAPAISWKTYRLALPVGGFWFMSKKVWMPGPHATKYWLGTPFRKDFMQFDGYQRAAEIDAPTLVLIGTKDGLVGTVGSHEKYARTFKNGSFKAINGAGHTFYQKEQEVAATIRQWLTSL